MSAVLDMRHYETLIAVVETGSVTAAARRLWVSQSALSHRLAEAERRLGAPLFDRRAARTLRPTPAARVLYQAARRALPELARAESDFLRTAGTDREVVRLSVASYDCYHWLPSFVAHAARALPGFALELVVLAGAPIHCVAGGATDLVIAPGARAVGGADAHPLFDDELVLLTAPNHPMSSQRWAEPEDLREEVYLTWGRTPTPGFEYERFFRPAEAAPRVVRVVEHSGAIAEMVASGLGVSILSRWALSPWIQAGKVVALRCGRGGLRLPWCSLVRAGVEASSPERRVGAALAAWLGATPE